MFYLTIEDLQLLNRSRIERLRSLYPEMLCCSLELTSDAYLYIISSDSSLLDIILESIAELQQDAWLFAGVEELFFWHKNSLYQHHPSTAPLKSNKSTFGDFMVATAEKVEIQEMNGTGASPATNYIPLVDLTAFADRAGKPIEEIMALLQHQQIFQPINGDRSFITQDTAVAMSDAILASDWEHYKAARLDQLMGREPAAITAVPNETEKAASNDAEAAATKQRQIRLTNFSVVKTANGELNPIKTIDSLMDSLELTTPETQMQLLNEIASQSELGKKYLAAITRRLKAEKLDSSVEIPRLVAATGRRYRSIQKVASVES